MKLTPQARQRVRADSQTAHPLTDPTAIALSVIAGVPDEGDPHENEAFSFTGSELRALAVAWLTTTGDDEGNLE